MHVLPTHDKEGASGVAGSNLEAYNTYIGIIRLLQHLHYQDISPHLSK